MFNLLDNVQYLKIVFIRGRESLWPFFTLFDTFGTQ